MRAKTRTGNFHTCEGCDRVEQDAPSGESYNKTIRPGDLKIVEGWKDADGDWIGDTDEYPTRDDLEEEGYDIDEVDDASYLTCPANDHDSDDGWEMEALDVAYACGVCMKSYIKLEEAAKCCDEEN